MRLYNFATMLRLCLSCPIAEITTMTDERDIRDGNSSNSTTTLSGLRFVKRLYLVVFLFCCTAYGQEVENMEINKNTVRIIFTGHTYPLLRADLQYYLADKIAAHDCDFIVLAGDVVTGAAPAHLGHACWDRSIAEEQWDKFSLFQSRLGKPVYYIPGNHDLSHDTDLRKRKDSVILAKQYTQLRSLYYAKRLKSCLLIFLNTVDISQENVLYQLDNEQLNWLTTLLKSSDGITTVILFMHHQLWDLEAIRAGQPVGDAHQFERDIKPLLSKYQSVYLFAGDEGYSAFVPQEEQALHYYAFSTTARYVGFYSITIDLDANQVSVLREAEILPPPIRKTAHASKAGTVSSELLVRAKQVLVSKRFWAGFAVAAVLFLCSITLYKMKRPKPFNTA